MNSFIVCRSAIQDGLAASAMTKVEVPLPHRVEIGLSDVFVAAGPLGGQDGVLLSAYATHPHGGLTPTVKNEGVADAGRFVVDCLIAEQ